MNSYGVEPVSHFLKQWCWKALTYYWAISMIRDKLARETQVCCRLQMTGRLWDSMYSWVPLLLHTALWWQWQNVYQIITPRHPTPHPHRWGVGCTVCPKKYAHGFCFAVLCCGYALTDFPISIRLTSLALWQSNDCPSASKATLMNMDKYFMWIHYERLHNHNRAKHNKTVCIFLGIYCILWRCWRKLTVL